MSKASQRKRMQDQARYRRLVESGLCVTCARQPAATGQRRCEGCRRRHSEYAAERRERLIAAGRCVICKDALSPGARLPACFRCRLAAAEYHVRYRQERKEAADG